MEQIDEKDVTAKEKERKTQYKLDQRTVNQERERLAFDKKKSELNLRMNRKHEKVGR